MVDDPTTADPAQPQPYDTVYLRPGNRLGIAPAIPLTVADFGPEPGVWELTHQEQHPQYWDWAAAATVGDIATVVRITADAARSWSLTHPEDPS
ncbi:MULTISPECIES: DUF6211 family protein [unclassified Streptomyces]|uniref:DUF6211 family protein n=1 Tax=unclassified Streptomyces TaxID=2593676 RepID=UPI0035E27D18